MLDCQAFYELLSARGVTLFAGVPDSLLKDLCAYITDHAPAARHVITANEGGAIALAAGHHLGTGELALVYLQNSGLGNTVNPLTSLTDRAVYGLPMLLVVGWRGEPGVRDEPQHVKMGSVTTGLLDAVGVRWWELPAELSAATDVVGDAVAHALEHQEPAALVVRKGTFAGYRLQQADPAAYPLTREEAIQRLVEGLPPGALVVSTTGKPSRELFEIREGREEPHDQDFLTVGCMGHASQIALGVALGVPARPVYCLDGDGAALMHLGGLSTIAQRAPATFKHVIVNNGAHDSVGGQPTVGFDVDLAGVARACGYRWVGRADSAVELRERLVELHAAAGPALLEVRVARGSRAALGRPTMTPAELKVRFGQACRVHAPR